MIPREANRTEMREAAVIVTDVVARLALTDLPAAVSLLTGMEASATSVTDMFGGTGGQLAAVLAVGAALVGSVLRINATQIMGAVGVGVVASAGARPPTPLMVGYIDEHRVRFEVEPICAVLRIAPSTYYSDRARRRDPASRGARRDEALSVQTRRVWQAVDLALDLDCSASDSRTKTVSKAASGLI